MDEVIVRAILSHGENTGVPRETLMEKALYACDEITGLITAVALVRPSKSLHDLEPSSVKKKWKDKTFAAWHRPRRDGKGGAGSSAWICGASMGNVIAAMRRIAPELGLDGRTQT